MSTIIEFEVPGQVMAQPRARAQVVHRVGRKAFAHIYTPDTARAWRERVLWSARQAVGFPSDPWSGTVLITIDAMFERDAERQQARYPDEAFLMDETPDHDNVAKAIMDALSPPRSKRGIKNEAILRGLRRGYLWIDDRQAHCGHVLRWWAPRGYGPGAIVTAQHIDVGGRGPTQKELACHLQQSANSRSTSPLLSARLGLSV